MKKMNLLSLGLVSLSALTLAVPVVLAAEDEVEIPSDVKGTSHATVLFGPASGSGGGEGEEGGGTGVTPVEPGGNIVHPDEETDVETGNGNADFNIMVSNFRFNKTDADGNYLPIALNANGMDLWAYGTSLKVKDIKAEDTNGKPLPEEMVMKNVPNFVQVWDNRGMNSGWTLKVSMDEFTGKDKAGKDHVLDKATLSLRNPSVKGPSKALKPDFESFFGKDEIFEIGKEAKTLMSAPVQKGTGNWSLIFGEIAEATKETPYQTLKMDEKGNPTSGVHLHIPAEALVQADVDYSAAINWILTDGPDAE